MTQPQPFTPMFGVYDLLTQIVQTNFSQPVFAGHKDNIQSTLRSAIAQTRSYTVQQAEDLHPIWVVIRNHTPTTDFLMQLASQLHMSLAGSALTFDALTANMAQAMGAYKGGSGNNTMMDPDLLARLPTVKGAEDVLKSNPWYVTLLLLSHRPQLLAG